MHMSSYDLYQCMVTFILIHGMETQTTVPDPLLDMEN